MPAKSGKRYRRPSYPPGRPITGAFLTGLADSLEYPGTIGRECGVLPSRSGRRPGLVELDSAGLLWLRHPLVAILENGWAAEFDPDDLEYEFVPLDTARLAPGRHDIYLGPQLERVECGATREFMNPETRVVELARVELAEQLVMVADDERYSLKDWIKLAEVVVEIVGGTPHCVLNAGFHPRFSSMAAYAHANPLFRLASTGLASLDDGGSGADTQSARIELELLQNIAAAAAPIEAAMQAQRCIKLLKAAGVEGFPAHTALDAFRLAPETVPDFLAQLGVLLAHDPDAPVYPEVIRVGDSLFVRLPGQFSLRDSWWVYDAPVGFHANRCLIYLPHVDAAAIPHLGFAQRPTHPTSIRQPAPAPGVALPGSALVMDLEIKAVGSIYLAPTVLAGHNRLSQLLRNGHALYVA